MARLQALPSNAIALIASFMAPKQSRALSFTCKQIHSDIYPILCHYRLPHDVAVGLGHALAAIYNWTLRIERATLFFSGRNAYDMIRVRLDKREIELHWWFGRTRHLCSNRINATVDDELNGELVILDKSTELQTTTRYSKGLLAALREADIHV
jgi:hypothetical protein